MGSKRAINTSEWLRVVWLWGIVMMATVSVPRATSADDISAEGGDTSVDDVSPNAFARPLANLSDTRSSLRHDLGERGFHRNFARVRIKGRITIGPKFNNVSCVSCHSGNGRGLASFGHRGSQSVLKVSATHGRSALPGGPIPVKGVGLQLRDHAVRGAKSDGRLGLLWELSRGAYGDGTPFELRKPVVQRLGASAKLPADTMFSLRRPPPVFGVGLLEAVDASTIIAHADPDDVDLDGISGRANIVWNQRERRTSIGRFGFKAASPSVLQQVAAAYSTDMGVTNPLFPMGDRIPDITRATLDLTTFYTRTLAVPRARGQDDIRVQTGRLAFESLGCARCHTSTLTTGQHTNSALSYQTIHPFTDLLLHDMGEELADGRSEFMATSREWRTSPLWGIGLTQTVLGGGEATYLHDGRARTLEEAILWHGGEAEPSRRGFAALSASERDMLIRFLRSL